MSTVLVLTPVIISSWPVISAAAAGAASALGFSITKAVQKAKAQAQQKAEVQQKAEIELAESQVLAQSVAVGQEIVLTKGTVTLRVSRNQTGRCTVCAEGMGQTKEQLHAVAEQFAQKMTQCFVYNRVMTELKAKGFQVVNEQMLEDKSVQIHVRRWEQ